MFNSTSKLFKIQRVKGPKITVTYEDSNVSEDGGIALVSIVDKFMNLLETVDNTIPDKRDQSKVQHSTLSMLQQRVYGLAAGYSDLNDHRLLRLNKAFQKIIGADSVLASSPTLCRFENGITKETALEIDNLFVEIFIASFKEAPAELILDFDATEITVHGDQEGKFYHGYYRNHCFLPTLVFHGKKLLVARLLPANEDPGNNAEAILRFLVNRLRQVWPSVRIVFRGDGGFCRQPSLDWCNESGVDYIVGLAGNAVLDRMAADLVKQAETQFNETKEEQCLFTGFSYAAQSWNKEQLVVCKAEYLDKGPNTRFVVTNIVGDPKWLYQELYCARGEMENRIKEVKVQLFSSRLSCHNWWANQFRLSLSALAYTLVEQLRAIALVGTEFANIQAETIRLMILKVKVRIIRGIEEICFLLTNDYPYKKIFEYVYNKLVLT